ncbi:acyl carrier protein [Thermoplasmatales archaeon SCGC AB-540-F20]|nr:acyl carrier protein [Thermoplasmatales archaeon SCGC AB-540-F20]
MNNNQDYNEKDIVNIITQFIINNFILSDQKENVDENISLYEKRIVDSTGVLEIVDFLEETFGIKIEDDELVPDNLDSIKKMSKFVQRKIDNAS